MRARFERSCGQYHHTINGEFVSGETAKRPIYRSNALSATTAEDWNDQNIRDFISLIDLQGIVKHVIKKSLSQSKLCEGWANAT